MQNFRSMIGGLGLGDAQGGVAYGDAGGHSISAVGFHGISYLQVELHGETTGFLLNAMAPAGVNNRFAWGIFSLSWVDI